MLCSYPFRCLWLVSCWVRMILIAIWYGDSTSVSQHTDSHRVVHVVDSVGLLISFFFNLLDHRLFQSVVPPDTLRMVSTRSSLIFKEIVDGSEMLFTRVFCLLAGIWPLVWLTRNSCSNRSLPGIHVCTLKSLVPFALIPPFFHRGALVC